MQFGCDRQSSRGHETKAESIESMDHATFNTKAAVAERNGALG